MPVPSNYLPRARLEPLEQSLFGTDTCKQTVQEGGLEACHGPYKPAYTTQPMLAPASLFAALWPFFGPSSALSKPFVDFSSALL